MFTIFSSFSELAVWIPSKINVHCVQRHSYVKQHISVALNDYAVLYQYMMRFLLGAYVVQMISRCLSYSNVPGSIISNVGLDWTYLWSSCRWLVRCRWFCQCVLCTVSTFIDKLHKFNSVKQACTSNQFLFLLKTVDGGNTEDNMTSIIQHNMISNRAAIASSYPIEAKPYGVRDRPVWTHTINKQINK